MGDRAVAVSSLFCYKKRIERPRKKDCYIFLVGANVALVYLVGVPPGIYLVSIPVAQ